jgi:3-methylfumaryl-CoA hydratase
MASEYPELEKLIGVKTVVEDVITATQLQRLNATLNRRDPMPKEGDPVPWGWHSLYFPRLMPTDKLDPDGMAADFEGAPASPLPRRMYAGNDLRFFEPLRIGDRATKEIFIKSVAPKEGRTGKLVFVTYGVRILGPRGLVLEDDQNIVFRDEEPAGTQQAAPQRDKARTDAPWKRTVTIDPVTLFRFSACTFNPHRIHYDYPYVRDVEGYPGLIVHGPLTAVLLLELLREHWKERALDMSGFSMRAKAPLFHNRPVTLLGEPAADGASCQLWAVDEVGNLAMEIAAKFRQAEAR